jgi:hypothetical protein
MDSKEVRAMHDALDRLAESPLSIADHLSDIRQEFDARTAEIQAGWTARHEQKANHYYLPPMEIERIASGDIGSSHRDTAD